MNKFDKLKLANSQLKQELGRFTKKSGAIPDKHKMKKERIIIKFEVIGE